MGNMVIGKADTMWNLTKNYWYHFLSLVSIVAFMMWGFSPVLSVFWATVVSLVTSFLRRDTALVSYDFFAGKKSFVEGLLRSPFVKAMEGGSIGVLNVAATCAGAGIIVGVVTLTGLGLKFSSIVIDYAGGSLLLTAVYTSLVVWIVGLAVPVTASYIICAVIAAPALIKLGVPDFAAHMFIFYYAVLSEVSPPTALSPFAAAAITGGDPYKTTLQCWKYTVPAFLVSSTRYSTDGAEAMRSRSNSRSRRSWTISMWSSPRNPQRNPKPSALLLSFSTCKAESLILSLSKASDSALKSSASTG